MPWGCTELQSESFCGKLQPTDIVPEATSYITTVVQCPYAAAADACDTATSADQGGAPSGGELRPVRSIVFSLPCMRIYKAQQGRFGFRLPAICIRP